ncbi:tRNA (adenosine(37)-N6)-threonylcarbamoyltransferase complex ATPase subunit type 1 TsaE [Paracoccus sp. TK19116]|uniref:tRNA threonylcarbamoyladenosine biosynthesis protein TsaE n=1 Tax=Paracoccus albicereus TaxID=2922394 RepID=A0ABT1MS12_9RHOB|nr:tRNA (adenosine(37)-N6)-threonylcarbamoyltransferase complex ATPase subunit type 1 TsaE [Paracoccus albicereus]MCQ0971087.1 tRNA (adenosine(37)-N6)-threonylcarbamoyltransferase complex ATPase subunit type 1 TsaE [Paracoccus albicereus]
MVELARIEGADEAQVAALARMLAATARPGQTILLDGNVGAGKTHFARAFIRARQDDAAEDVPSPTFTLVQTYLDAKGVEIWHADLYRLTDGSELDELGLLDAMADGICLIEWPDRMETVPPAALWMSLRPGTSPDLRDITLQGDPSHWPDLRRSVERVAMVVASGWTDAGIEVLAGDASARRYFRLRHEGESAVLMDDAPPGSTAAYLAMTDWLRSRGFSAPEVLAAEPHAGLLLLEDLGDDLVARVIETDPTLAQPIYARIIDLLVDLAQHAPPDFVTKLDGSALADLVAMFAEWYPKAAGVDPARAAGIAPLIAQLYDQLAGDAPLVLSLRDFHAENLIWRGEAPLGILDFQDAVAAHPAYDLVSALQDARRDVDEALEAEMIARHVAATGSDPDRFAAIYALLGVQRGLRIMGIFTRLAVRDGKARYLDFMPRVWEYIQRDLRHPAMAPLAIVMCAIPAPTVDIIQTITAKAPVR